MGRWSRRTFAAERGRTQWLVTAASGALLVAAIASLPALAGEPDAAPEQVVSTSVESGAGYILGEPLEDVAGQDGLSSAASDYEGVIGEPIEDEVVDASLDAANGDYEGIIGEPLEDVAGAEG
jgi:hypothetical protein